MLERLLGSGGRGDRPAPGPLGRGRMRRRLRQRQRVREALLLDLGALVYELHRQGERRPELLQAKAADLTTVDREVRALSEALQVGHTELQLVAAGITGSCPTCGELLTTDTHYCPHCGTPAGPALTARHEERLEEIGGTEERELRESPAEDEPAAEDETEPAAVAGDEPEVEPADEAEDAEAEDAVPAPSAEEPVSPWIHASAEDAEESAAPAAEDDAPTREQEALEAAVGDVAAGARAAGERPVDEPAESEPEAEAEGATRRALRRARERIRGAEGGR